MPSGRSRTKEDTWKEKDLKKSLKDANDEIREDKRRRERDDRDKKRDRRDDVNEDDHRRRRDDDKHRSSKENGESRRDRDDKRSSHSKEDDRMRDKERSKDRDRERDRERDKERDREKRDKDRDREHRDRDRDRDRDKDRNRDRDRDRDKDRDRERRDKDRDRERDRHKERDEARKGSGIRQRTYGKEDGRRRDDRRNDDDRKRDRDRDKDRDRDRDKDRDRDRDREKDRDRHRDKDRDKDRDRDRDRDKDRDRDRHRDRESEKDRERRKEKERDRDRKDRDRDKDRDKDRDRSDRDRDRDKDRDRRHRDRDNDSQERRRDRDDRKSKDKDDDSRRRDDRRSKDDDRRRDDRRRDKDDDRRRRDDERDRHRNGQDKVKEGSESGSRDRESGSRDRRSRDGDGRDRKHRSRDEDSRERQRDEGLKEDKDEKKDKSENSEGSSKSGDRMKEEERKKEERRDKDRDRRSEKKEDNDKRKSGKEDKSPLEEVPSAIVVEEEEAGDDYGDYEDDFEDYDDDFEDDDGDEEDAEPSKPSVISPRLQQLASWNAANASNEEMDEVLRAMNEENERLMSESKRSNWSESPDYSDDSPPQRSRPVTARNRTFINFVSAKQRQISNKAASKAKKRGQELFQLIELDVVQFDLFDMPPVQEYSLYMRSFGRTNAQQAYVQTNDDNIEREIQTDEIEIKEKWTQHPAEAFRGCGGGDKEVDEEEEISNKMADTVRLNKFLQKAGQAVAILLEEDQAEKSQKEVAGSKTSVAFSDSVVQLGTPPFLAGRHMTYCHYSPVQTNLLLTVYSLPAKGTKVELATKGMLCVWNTNEPSRPKQVLVCESQPVCCCFSPSKSTLAFAGLVDGSIVVWDLREPGMMHRVHKSGDQNWLLRNPTYDTAGVLGSDNHHSPVSTVLPIVSASDSARASLINASGKEDDLGSGLTFQLASIEANAVMNLWVVAEIPDPDLAGSESDLGLAPGGRIKLLKSSTFSLVNPVRDLKLKVGLHANEMALSPNSPNHFYVGTDSGFVYHGVRYGGKSQPRVYKGDVDAPVPVTCLDFSPFDQPCFLAGCADGSVRLHSIHTETPLITWLNSTSGKAVISLRWSRSRPSVFYVLDEASNLHVWDLLRDDSLPVDTEKYSNGRLISFALCNDHSSTGLGLPGRHAQMVLSLDTGIVELHTLSKQLTVLKEDDMQAFKDYLEKI